VKHGEHARQGHAAPITRAADGDEKTMFLTRFVLVALLAALACTSVRAQATIFSDDFESGLVRWTVIHPAGCLPGAPCSGNVTWQIEDETTDCGSWAVPFPSSSRCARFGHVTNCDFAGDNQAVPDAELRMMQSVPLPAGALSTLHFFTKSDAEDNGHDLRTVEILTPSLINPVVLATLSSSDWHDQSVDLTPYAGYSAQIIFRFRCTDAIANDGNGWFIDDVRIESTTSTPFCFGDGTGTACPCANAGATGHGCASSIDPNGALLTASGTPLTSLDTMTLSAAGLSSSVVLFFQGTQQASGGQGSVFGDGLRCAGGSIVRLHSVQASGGVAQFPGPSDPQLHVAGQVPLGGGVRTYQVWYRNAAAFCTPSTFNLTNGLQIAWQ
jgi:hypothetical protein